MDPLWATIGAGNLSHNRNTRKNARDNHLFKFLGEDSDGRTNPLKRFKGCNTLLEMVHDEMCQTSIRHHILLTRIDVCLTLKRFAGLEIRCEY